MILTLKSIEFLIERIFSYFSNKIIDFMISRQHPEIHIFVHKLKIYLLAFQKAKQLRNKDQSSNGFGGSATKAHIPQTLEGLELAKEENSAHNKRKSTKQHGFLTQINSKVSVIQQLTPIKDGPQKAKPIKQAQVRQNFLEGNDQITQKRQNLVQMVINQGCGLTKTAKKLNLKLSTAKLILRKYKQTGKFHIRRLRKSSVENNVAPVVKEQDDASSSKEQLENHSCQKVQQPIIHANLYPIMYNQFCYAYNGVYGVWPVNNFYQFI